MLRNRTLQIKMIKDEPKQLTSGQPVQHTSDDITEQVADITDTVVSGAVTIMGTYMLADTVRKIVIHAFTR